MVSVNEIVNVNLSIQDRFPLRRGFGVPLLLASHDYFADPIRYYTSLGAMVTDGFQTNDAAYRMASAFFSQQPRGPRVAIGRRTLRNAQVVHFTPTKIEAGTTYTIFVEGNPATYVVETGDVLADVTAGIHAAIVALAVPGLTATEDMTKVTCTTDVAGRRIQYTGYNHRILTVLATHTNPGIETDLADIAVEDSTWYGLVIDSVGEPEILAASTWAGANKKLFFAQSTDSITLTSSTADVFTALRNAGSTYTVPVYHAGIGEYASAAAAGMALSSAPGSINLAFKPLSGIPQTPITDGEATNLIAKNANFYRTMAGQPSFYDGRTSGTRFADIQHIMDWMQSEIQMAILGVLQSTKKIGFTKVDHERYRGPIQSVLDEGIRNNGIADGSTNIFLPEPEDLATADRAARSYKGIVISARLTGAHNSVSVDITLTV